MKRINWKIANLALWIEVLLTYVLPFKAADGMVYRAGFPISYISVYDKALGASPLLSMHLNPLGFLANGIVIYLLLCGVVWIGRRLV